MKNKFEKALFVNRIQDIKKNIDRIYFGNEFCENLIPTLDALKRWYFFTKNRNKEFTFVTPFVTNFGLKKLKKLLTFLNSQKNVEVVCNDWGVFKLIKDNFENLDPVLGRLLTKQRRDPRILKIFLHKQKTIKILNPNNKIKAMVYPKKVPYALFEHYQASIINSPIFQKYLLSQNINRVEIDNLVWKMNVKVNRKVKVSIYLPYGYITTARACGRLTLTYAACKKECKKYFLRLENNTLPVPFYGIGNTVFYKSKSPSDKYLKKLGIDRIIYQPRLPF
ncbi:MAG: hypothetical protein P9L98_03920 [Candidatus Kaelpia imicola]|nr:hypothetical protein [Candidatus Kaelpia imicola]